MPAWTTLEIDDSVPHVCTIRLNRPAQRNALNAVLAEELLACFETLRRVRDLRAVVLTGNGAAFCAGGDLKERLEGGAAQTQRQRRALLEAMEHAERLDAPVIAMINGAALAGGLELALACDIRIAAESARVGLPEVRTAGAFPGGGGPVRLPKLIGRGRASLVVFTGRSFSAREARELGFVEMVVPDAELGGCTRQIVDEIVQASPLGVGAAKQLIRRSMDMPVDAAMALSAALRDPLDSTADTREGMAAWREKRAPRFRGE